MFLRGTLQTPSAEDWCSQTGTLQTQMSNEATDGLAPSVLDYFSGTARAAFHEFPPASEEDPRGETAGSDSHLAPEAWRSRNGTLQAQRVEEMCSRKGPQMSHEATDGLARSVYVISRAQLERILAFFHQRAKRTRGEKPRVRIGVMLPRPGVPGRFFPPTSEEGPRRETACSD